MIGVPPSPPPDVVPLGDPCAQRRLTGRPTQGPPPRVLVVLRQRRPGPPPGARPSETEPVANGPDGSRGLGHVSVPLRPDGNTHPPFLPSPNQEWRGRQGLGGVRVVPFTRTRLGGEGLPRLPLGPLDVPRPLTRPSNKGPLQPQGTRGPDCRSEEVIMVLVYYRKE